MNCEFTVGIGGDLKRCSQKARWIGIRLGTPYRIMTCDGHKHFLEDPKEMSNEGS